MKKKRKGDTWWWQVWGRGGALTSPLVTVSFKASLCELFTATFTRILSVKHTLLLSTADSSFCFQRTDWKKEASKQVNNKQPVSLCLAKGVSSNLEAATICLPDFCFCLCFEWATVYDRELENAWHLPSSWQLSARFLPLSLQYTCVHIHPPINLFLLFSLPESSSKGKHPKKLSSNAEVAMVTIKAVMQLVWWQHSHKPGI